MALETETDELLVTLKIERRAGERCVIIDCRGRRFVDIERDLKWLMSELEKGRLISL